MSERQAKLNRKSAPAPEKQKRDKFGIVTTIAAVVIAIGVAAAGGYAVWDKIGPEPPVVTTVADIAAEYGITAEELIQKVGMEGITPETESSEFNSKLTIDGYAKLEDKTAEQLKAEMGIESLSDDTLWQEASMKVPMGKVAEQSGTTFEEFATQNALPETITAQTTYEDAMKIMQETAAASAETAEAPAE